LRRSSASVLRIVVEASLNQRNDRQKHGHDNADRHPFGEFIKRVADLLPNNKLPFQNAPVRRLGSASERIASD
jgi:hypothetical protein